MFKNKTSYFIVTLFLIFSFSFSSGALLAVHSEETTSTTSTVESITLSGAGSVIEWETDGNSPKGFKVVWSKNSEPTYPLRSGDKYHYYSEPSKNRDELTAFSGSGTYYVRVCEYLGGECGLYSNEITLTLAGSSEKTCTENDQGIDYYEYSKVVTTNENVTGKYYDLCVDGGDVLHEWYCDSNTAKKKEYNCPHGCTDGACKKEGSDAPAGVVEKIELLVKGDNVVKWETDGYSTKGFKVVWSKNSGPTYPLREGDKYLYFSDPNHYYTTLIAFSGVGRYYVRVCEYLGDACGTYSNEVEINLTNNKEVACTLDYSPVCGKDGKTYSNKCMLDASGVAKRSYGECVKDDQIKAIEDKASKLSNNQLDDILAELQALRDLVKEQQNQILHLHRLLSGVAAVTTAMQDSINQFITYGVDDNTKKLGEGERAAVMYSYKEAFGKLPEGEDDLADAIKIANGRWPSKKSETAEYKAKQKFKEIYKRDAEDKMNDNAAVVIMSYGLRQKAENRKLESEKQGLKIFKDIYNKLPETTDEWNMLQAITYSGATR